MKPSYEELEQKLIESERYGRQTDITIDNLQMQVEKLAAENAWLKNAITAVSKTSEECEINGDELKYVVEPSEFDALTDLLDETPATDAFLAEVRAQGVEMFAAHKRERQQALRSRSMRMSEEAAGMAADAENFAAQLRKGVQA